MASQDSDTYQVSCNLNIGICIFLKGFVLLKYNKTTSNEAIGDIAWTILVCHVWWSILYETCLEYNHSRYKKTISITSTSIWLYKICCTLVKNKTLMNHWQLDAVFQIWLVVVNPDSKVHGANMEPTWFLSAPDGPRVGPMNLAIREYMSFDQGYDISSLGCHSVNDANSATTTTTTFPLCTCCRLILFKAANIGAYNLLSSLGLLCLVSGDGVWDPSVLHYYRPFFVANCLIQSFPHLRSSTSLVLCKHFCHEDNEMMHIFQIKFHLYLSIIVCLQ